MKEANVVCTWDRHIPKYKLLIYNYFLLTNLLTYLLTPWCRVLLEKLTGSLLVKKFPAFHGTRRLITALTSVRHLSLPWASPIQSIYPHPTSWRSILILSTHLRLVLPSGLLPSGFPSMKGIHRVIVQLDNYKCYNSNMLFKEQRMVFIKWS